MKNKFLPHSAGQKKVNSINTTERAVPYQFAMCFMDPLKSQDRTMPFLFISFCVEKNSSLITVCILASIRNAHKISFKYGQIFYFLF